MMFGSKCFEEFAVIGGLLLVQAFYAANAVIMSHLMSIGLSPFFLIIYGSFATSLFLFPLAVYFERNKWPSEFRLKLFGQFLLLSFGGVTLFQYLMLLGVKKTSPAVASAMPNLAPGFIFIIAWVLRFEKVDLRCKYSKIKILGTLTCVVGAVMMSFLHAPGPISESTITIPDQIAVVETNEDVKIVGIVCLLAAILILSSIIVLQAATLADFPAPMSLCAITSFLGALITAVVKSIEDRGVAFSGPYVKTGDIIAFALLGGFVGGTCTSFQSWAMKKRGPVYVSTFNPIGTVCSVILSALTLGDSITLGSLLGMTLMFTGLYSVLWAKKKEDYAVEPDIETPKVYEAKKPLLC